MNMYPTSSYVGKYAVRQVNCMRDCKWSTAPVLFTGMGSPLVRSFRGSFASLRKAGFAVREGRLDHFS